MTTFHGGAVIGRGPMSTDHYTQVHNLAVRGAIKTQYVGVFCYITSHRQGWRLTAARVAKDLGVGKDFVASALGAFEAAGCLIRGRVRSPEGTLGDAIWFVTDLPLQLRQLGITDERVIRERVTAAYDQWRAEYEAARQDPDAENPMLASTSANTDTDRCLPRSEPKSDQPTLDQPGLADPPHKKNKGSEDHTPPPPTPSPPAGRSPRGRQREGGGGGGHERATPTDAQRVAAEVVNGLPAVGGSRIGETLHSRLVAEVAARLMQGWSPAEVTAELTRDLDTARNTGVYVHRMGELPARPPHRRPSPARSAVPPHAWVEGPNGVCGQPGCSSSAVSGVHIPRPRTATRRCVHDRVVQACPSCRGQGTRPADPTVASADTAARAPDPGPRTTSAASP